MESIRININEPCPMLKEIEVIGIKKIDEGYRIILNLLEKVVLSVGDRIIFKRYKDINDKSLVIAERSAVITKVNDVNDFVIEKFENKKYYVNAGEFYRESNDEEYYLVTLPEKHNMTEWNILQFISANTNSEIASLSNETNGSTYISLCDIDSLSIIDTETIRVKLNVFEKESLEGKIAVTFNFNDFFFLDSLDRGWFWTNEVATYYDDSYYNVCVGFSQDDDTTRLLQDTLRTKNYTENVKNSLITEPIDMEKIKYVPVYPNGVTAINEIDFNFHFRERVIEDKEKCIYKKGWYINESVNGWNGVFETVSDIYKEENKGQLCKSDLLCYLDFNDKDIEYSKKKVSQSFIRVSFYTDTDPIEQKLLYYSTMFLDSGNLLGRYIRKKRVNKGKWDENADPKHIIRIEDNKEENRISTQITTMDEFNTFKNSEGFNLYLFAADAIENNIINENEESNISARTIYMKVEFNHAGYGRTIPFIVWPKEENGEAKKLILKDYIQENQYIPVTITCINGKYVYYFEGANLESKNDGIVIENDKLIFNLFEPIIEADKEE